jgi:A/G-specific adenine glycosylase
MPRTSTPHAPKPKAAQAFTRRLLAWFARAGRDLPWRRTRDPYRVLVSEFMLQQTQVRRVAEYYPRFLERFASLESLARARPSAVREAWDGLGYYARARNLHALARQVTRRGDAAIPSDPAELVKLPGVGRYTAGAVASFAYEQPVAAVDTNVGRVLKRVFFGSGERGAGPRGETRKHGSRRKVPLPAPRSSGFVPLPAPRSPDIWTLAQTLVPKDGKRAWRFNQAMMELGAMVCTARAPKCGGCPVRTVCRTGGG